jgi:hypothetical protein
MQAGADRYAATEDLGGDREQEGKKAKLPHAYHSWRKELGGLRLDPAEAFERVGAGERQVEALNLSCGAVAGETGF